MKIEQLILCCLVLLFVVAGCFKVESYKEMEERFLAAAKPRVTGSLPETFNTITEVKKIDGLDGVGHVVIKRIVDGNLFSALVIPMREIEVQSEVKISEVHYVHNSIGFRVDFFVVQ